MGAEELGDSYQGHWVFDVWGEALDVAGFRYQFEEVCVVGHGHLPVHSCPDWRSSRITRA